MYAAEKPPLKETYLEHIASTGKHDLIFFEKRSTPKVVPKGQSFTAPESYGKQTKRRSATEEEEKTIARGDWVRVDQSGKKGGEDGYKKTKMKGREHLVHEADVEAYLEHVGVKGMRWGVRKDGSSGKSTAKKVAKGAAVVAGATAVGFLMTRHGRNTVANLARRAVGKRTVVANPFDRLNRQSAAMFAEAKARSDRLLSSPRPVRRVGGAIPMPGGKPRMPSASAMQTRVKDISQGEWRNRVNSLSKDIAEANRKQDAWMRSLGLGGAGLRR